MGPVASGNLKESRIETTVMRKTMPSADDPRPWQMVQCPHCNGIFWAWAKGTVSYWSRNPLRRLMWWVNSIQRG
jgi:hypothetical protein